MFETRLRVCLSLLGLAALAVVARLAQLQIVRGEAYRERVAALLVEKPQSLPFVRGRILDRVGDPLVSDEPSWDLCVDYAVIAHEPRHIRLAVHRWKRDQRYPGARSEDAIERAYRAEMEAVWRRIEDFTHAPNAGAQERFIDPEGIYARVRAVHAAVAAHGGFERSVREEHEAHAVVTGLTRARQIVARQRFADCPWVSVRPSSIRRFAADTEAFVHVLGRLGRVTAKHIEHDADAWDPFGKYLPDEHAGISGVERAAEQALRGRRGRIKKDRNGAVLDVIQPENGADVTLTIDGRLQRRLYRLMGATLAEIREERRTDYPRAGAIVVLDIGTREVLALVSYPGFDPASLNEHYADLRDDTEAQPLRFRAVAHAFAPGSIVKPLVCLAGLVNGAITLETRETCAGYLHADTRSGPRCWLVAGTGRRMAHGPVNVVEAIRGSCNIFMYRTGERVGVDRLCSTFRMAGLGRSTGIGLAEEVVGMNRNTAWRLENLGLPTTPGVAWNYAIGQGDLQMTPLQVANLVAVYATGRFRPVTLLRGGPPAPEWILPGTPAQWRAIRRGVYEVVNHPGGTAYRYAHLSDPQYPYALCGKTGTATTQPWPTSYNITYRDDAGVEKTVVIRAGAQAVAVARFRAEHPSVPGEIQVRLATRWPPPLSGNDRHAHAWFGGFLQPLAADGSPDWSQPAPVAISVLVEFGGSGGRVAGALARQVSGVVFELLGPDLGGGDGPDSGAVP
ncbi:MAG: penicillin-binding transpeptidase domain-containing protein [Phycisphaerae bacterium]